METMITELANRVWTNPRFHEAARRMELAWLKQELGVASDIVITHDEANKLIRAAAILACSNQQSHREAAFQAATRLYDLIGKDQLPLDQAVRVVLARLGNFPSFATRRDIDAAQSLMPLSLVAEELNSAAARTVVLRGEALHLTNFQFSLWSSLSADAGVALSAPTSAGKSFVLQNYIVSLFGDEKPRSVVYIVPTRALITQVAVDLVGFFDRDGSAVPEIVVIPPDSDITLPTKAIYVMTQERLQLSLASHSDFQASVIVVDEAQSIADGARGVLLQWILDDLLLRNRSAQILFASPNVRNLDVFGRLFALPNLHELTSTEPTVSQNFLVVKIENATKGQISIHRALADLEEPATEIARVNLGHTTASRLEKLVHIAAKLGQRHTNIVYANGPADAEKIAIQLADLFADREVTPARTELSDLAKEVVHPNYVLVECIKHGIAFHYANIPAHLRRAVEDAVSNGDVDYLVCTSTLLQGVNLPVRNIFMCRPEKGQSNPLESTDFWNLAGRAGRLRREFQGNIFLIDYTQWKKKPLDGPRDGVIVPAIEKTVRQNQDHLVTTIKNERIAGRGDDPVLETAFVRLYSDLKRGELVRTLSRIGLASDSQETATLAAALETASSSITLPGDVVRLSPNISAHKQEELFQRLLNRVTEGREAAVSVIPLHPRESDAYKSYTAILKLCDEIILNIDTSRGLHRFHALMAIKWMKGVPLPQIIEDQIQLKRRQDQRTIIRDTLEVIETKIRFEAVRLFGCYNTLLVFALENDGKSDLVSGIPALPLYLEVGASDRTMISFIALGLSRVTAMKLNEMSVRKDLDVPSALHWLRGRPLESLGLSPLLMAEVQAIIRTAA